MAAASLLPGTWAPRTAGTIAALALAVFAAATLVLQSTRRRRLPDVSLTYWRVAMASLAGAALLFVARPAWPAANAAQLEVFSVLLAIVGFALSVIEGMLLKIVPFLAWFHLQARAGLSVRVPNVKDFLPDRPARWQLRAHVAALSLLLPAVGWPAAFWPAVAAFAASQCVLGWNLWRTAWRFRTALAQLG